MKSERNIEQDYDWLESVLEDGQIPSEETAVRIVLLMQRLRKQVDARIERWWKQFGHYSNCHLDVDAWWIYQIDNLNWYWLDHAAITIRGNRENEDEGSFSLPPNILWMSEEEFVEAIEQEVKQRQAADAALKARTIAQEKAQIQKQIDQLQKRLSGLTSP